MTSSPFPVRSCRDLAISRTSARPAARASRPKSICGRASLQINASYTFIDARFLNAVQVGSNSPFADANGNIQILPGNQIPAVPRDRIKASIDYAVTDAFKVGGDALFVGSQYFVGDGSNSSRNYLPTPSSTCMRPIKSTRISKFTRAPTTFFDNRYATYGTFFDTGALPNFANGGAPFTDPRSLSPARPRAFYTGLKVTF